MSLRMDAIAVMLGWPYIVWSVLMRRRVRSDWINNRINILGFLEEAGFLTQLLI